MDGLFVVCVFVLILNLIKFSHFILKIFHDWLTSLSLSHFLSPFLCVCLCVVLGGGTVM